MLHGLKVHPAQDQPQGSKQPAHKLCGTPRKLSTSGQQQHPSRAAGKSAARPLRAAEQQDPADGATCTRRLSASLAAPLCGGCILATLYGGSLLSILYRGSVSATTHLTSDD